MFVMYSKSSGEIISISESDVYTKIEQLYPYDYKDYEVIYGCLNIEFNQETCNNPKGYYIDTKTLELKKKVTGYSIEELIKAGILTHKDLEKLK